MARDDLLLIGSMYQVAELHGPVLWVSNSINSFKKKVQIMSALKTSSTARLGGYLAAGLLLICGGFNPATAAQNWSTKLDGKVRFYQSTELGVLVVGTEKSLYAVDGG